MFSLSCKNSISTIQKSIVCSSSSCWVWSICISAVLRTVISSQRISSWPQTACSRLPILESQTSSKHASTIKADHPMASVVQSPTGHLSCLPIKQKQKATMVELSMYGALQWRGTACCTDASRSSRLPAKIQSSQSSWMNVSAGSGSQ